MGGIFLTERYCYFFFSGYYVTAKAAEVLERNQICCRIVKSPVILRNGCSFALRVASEDGQICRYMIERAGIGISGSMVMNAR